MEYRPLKLQDLKIGLPVIYHPFIGSKEGKETVISSEPWELGSGTIVVRVDGQRGGVSLKALSEVEK